MSDDDISSSLVYFVIVVRSFVFITGFKAKSNPNLYFYPILIKFEKSFYMFFLYFYTIFISYGILFVLWFNAFRFICSLLLACYIMCVSFIIFRLSKLK